MVQDKQVTAISPAARGASPATDAASLLTADHLEVQALFEQYDRLVNDRAAGENRRALAQAICVMLTVQITAEEELFFPAACAAIGAHDVLREAAVEHDGCRHLIADIVNMTPVDPLLDATVRVLGARVDQRMREKEGRLFPKLGTAGLDLGALGMRIAERKRELMAEMEEGEA